MNPDNEFFFILLLTVITVRLFLFFRPTAGPTLYNWRIHHYHVGIILILLGWLTHSIIVYGIGVGLFIDELTYLILRGKTHQDNYSWPSVIGTIFWLGVAFAFRGQLLFFI